jgi:hypothetical protein
MQQKAKQPTRQLHSSGTTDLCFRSSHALFLLGFVDLCTPSAAAAAGGFYFVLWSCCKPLSHLQSSCLPPTSVRLISKIINNDHRRCATNGNCCSLVCRVLFKLVAIWFACCLVGKIVQPQFTNSPLKTMSNVLH